MYAGGWGTGPAAAVAPLAPWAQKTRPESGPGWWLEYPALVGWVEEGPQAQCGLGGTGMPSAAQALVEVTWPDPQVPA